MHFKPSIIQSLKNCLVSWTLNNRGSTVEAARIATGTTKLVSIENLYSEIGWDTLETRRNKQKFTLFYKMVCNLTPYYLSSLDPSTVTETSRYNLRNSNDIRTVNARTSQYFNSFLQSAIREWNSLPEEHRNSTVTSFQYQLKQPTSFILKFYYVGERQTPILHTRLRTMAMLKMLNIIFCNAVSLESKC